MCGIAGYAGPRTLSPAAIASTLQQMRRRGPDARDWWHATRRAGRHVYLLHSRLNIIDLHDRSNQPFRSGSCVVAFNGEIYNYIELREVLRQRGRAFATASDTEVLASLLAEDGWRGLDGCEGMWALAACDDATGRLTLSRDRFGEKPLYLHRDHEGGIYFGSEAKFIFALLGRRLPPDETQLRRYLVNGYKALQKAGATFFEGLEELPAASALTVSADGTETLSRYWSPSFDTNETMTYPEAVDGVRTRLERAVALRLRADVPAAFCMSGGIDSTSLASLAKRRLGYDVHAFTVDTPDARYEERGAVEHVVAALGLRHTWVPAATPCFLDDIRALVTYHDAPVYTISYYVQWLLLSQVASAGYRISIMGSGADELLTGYYDHHNLFLAEVHGTPVFAAAKAAWDRHVRPLVRNPLLQNPLRYVEAPGARDHVFDGSERFASYLVNDWQEAFRERAYAPSLLRNRMLNELFEEVVPVMLHEDDLNAMYFSIENRSPFLDRELAEFCFSIPSTLLIRDGYAKAILRDAMAGLVPDEILKNRRKVGFNAPIEAFLTSGDARVREWLLDDGPVYERVRRDRVETLCAQGAFTNTESKFLFNLICTKAFLEQESPS
ncbi:MAG: asparagine synthase (glutamine-hydrolyzing) [Vicinamibacterales bacterium]